MTEPIKLTEAQRKILAATPADGAPVGPGWVGYQVWGKPWRQRQAYARPAGKILRQLESLGLVVWGHPAPGADSISWGWLLTGKGQQLLKEGSD